ncbi:methyl-accepting chemotaxis protein [Thalassotalea sp. 1_MG-2023]|uniref:methyl-accepting chemotaxis protein n=1 Tax=Thalassotalea sp. 1_MG-2023 TaxID=3062680 RepID=UPI0026E1386E|nr:methyl-accepting chemotaxis protein [Thalassotalea sp. 1_MG-2023]MDO6427321.1 methyl-accepting chemotaxis protein [Thalassotalea sp. 1_MG-2023]
MFDVYRNMKVMTKALLAPSLILVLMVVLLILTILSLDQVKRDITGITEDLAPDSNTASLILEQVYNKRLQVKQYLQTSNESAVTKFKAANNELEKHLNQANANITNPQRAQIINTLISLNKEYQQAFYNTVVKQMQVRHDIVNQNLDVNGPEIESKLSQIMLSAFEDSDAESAYLAGDTLRSLLLVRLYVFKYLMNNNQSDKMRVFDELKATTNNAETLKATLSNNQRRTLLAQAETQMASYQEGFTQLVQAIETRNQAVTNVLDVKGPEMAALASQLRNSVFDAMHDQGEVSNTSLTNTEITTTVITLLSIVSGIIISYFVAKGIVGPILATNASLSDIANGEGDLTKRIPVNSKDEIGQLAESFNVFVAKLQGLIGEIANATSQLSAASEEMSVVTKDTQSQVEHQTQETIQVASAINELATTVREVASNAEEASNSATVADSAAQSGNQVIAETVVAINNLTEEIEQSAGVISTLKVESEGIGTVLDVIKSIAEQTNLLALNAAIEAARAGESGRGFAVVADEVRTLAQKTQHSTKEIETLIHNLQSGADNAVHSMSQNRESIIKLATQAESATSSLYEITTKAGLISDMNAMIATAAEEQSTVVNDVNASVHNIQDVASQTAASTEQISTASASLAELGATLRNLVNQFKI